MDIEHVKCITQKKSDDVGEIADWPSNIIYINNTFKAGDTSADIESKTIKVEDEDVIWIDDEESNMKIEYDDTSESVKDEEQMKERKTEGVNDSTNIKLENEDDMIMDDAEDNFVQIQYVDISESVKEEEQEQNTQTDPFAKNIQKNGKIAGTYPCKYCNITFRVRSSYRFHIKRCKKEFLSKKTENRTVKEKKHRCSFCQYQTWSYQTLKHHITTHTGNRPFDCHFCNYKAKTKSQLKSHIMFKHSHEKPFQCEFCSYRCVTATHLKRHTYTHQEQKMFKCNECDYVTVTAVKLRTHKYKHLDRVKDMNEKMHRCMHCQYETVYSHNLERHSRIHSGERPFACHICDYRASQKGNLKQHIMARHMLEKKYKCSLCPYKSATLRGFKYHMVMHHF